MVSPERCLLGVGVMLRRNCIHGPELQQGRLVAEQGSAGAWPQEGCVWSLVEFLLPKDLGYCLSAHGCPQPGTRPGQRQVLSKYL